MDADLSDRIGLADERFVPGTADGELIEVEHLVRYRWAGQLVAGRRVLDVLDDLEADDHVEAPCLEGQRVDVAGDEGCVGGRTLGGGLDRLGREIEPHDLGCAGAGQRRAAVADAAA